MAQNYSEIRGQAMGIESSSTRPTAGNTVTGSLVAGKTYTDPTTGTLYIYDGSRWAQALGGTTTSTSTSSTSSSSTSSTSSSTSSTSSSTSSTSSSSSSSSTSTTLF